ncbi:hypothetical protein JYU34_020678, partial [Plutella xylostella]
MTNQNVTQRRKEIVVNIPTNNSFESLSEGLDSESEVDYSPPNSDTPNKNSTSNLPRSSSCSEIRNAKTTNELEHVKEKITNLEMQLKSAECEIEAMLTENYCLKNELTKYNKKVDQLTKLCLTPNANIKKIKKQKKSNNINNKTMPNLLFESETDEPELESLQEQIKQSATLGEEPRLPGHKNVNGTKLKTENIGPSVDKDMKPKQLESQKEQKNKVVIIGDEQITGITPNLMALRKKHWNDRFKCISFVKPNAESSSILSESDFFATLEHDLGMDDR